MTTSPDLPDRRDRVAASTRALVRTVDGLSAEELAGPSGLPGWTRAHVVAHLALNAEGLARAVEGAARGESVPMYDSDERRDADIEELAAAEPTLLRERLLASTTAFEGALGLLAPERADASVPRTPGGQRFPVAVIPAFRRREVEIHHADLDAGYTHRDWPDDFAGELLDHVVRDRADAGPFRVRADDLGRDWEVGGAGGPVVSGTAADLGWWLCGRGRAGGLSVADGVLPELGRWR